LDGVSYVDRIVYQGAYNEVDKASRWLQQQFQGREITIAQYHRHPYDNKRVTESYQKENWRLAGSLSEFGKHPLVFDQRDAARDAAISRLPGTDGMRHILLATGSVSSPFKQAGELKQALLNAFPNCVLYDLSGVHAERIYDLVALYDKALCMVSVDTVHLHLARAARVPVVSIINDGFFGSIPPPASVAAIRYSDPDLVHQVVEAVRHVVDAQDQYRFVIQTVNMHGDTPRHKRAQATWPAAFGDESIVDCFQDKWTYDARRIDDPRSVPTVQSMFQDAINRATSPDDVILFHNSDVGLLPGCVKHMRRHAAVFGAFSMRRVEPGATYTHIGRDLFAFRADWLAEHLPSFPIFYMGCPYFDLVIAAIIRKDRGIVSTIKNMEVDFYPCEMAPGMATHEPHKSAWVEDGEHTLPGNLFNRRAAMRWCRDNMPSLVL
jgi:hypothetical protein